MSPIVSARVRASPEEIFRVGSEVRQPHRQQQQKRQQRQQKRGRRAEQGAEVRRRHPGPTRSLSGYATCATVGPCLKSKLCYRVNLN